MKRVCKDCGKEFTITDSEIDFYKEKNLELPKRCSECRSKNKAKNMQGQKLKNINEDSVRANNTSDNNFEHNRNKNKNTGNKTFRNAIIAAIILIASFFGWNINSNWNTASTNDSSNTATVEENYSLTFRNDTLLEDHFKKHGSEFNYKTKEEYLKGAIDIVNSSSSKQKTEEEDGDKIYYSEEKNEIVFVSKDGYIRTYFKPSDGINYFNRQ